jgi:hypothetical protein
MPPPFLVQVYPAAGGGCCCLPVHAAIVPVLPAASNRVPRGSLALKGVDGRVAGELRVMPAQVKTSPRGTVYLRCVTTAGCIDHG